MPEAACSCRDYPDIRLSRAEVLGRAKAFKALASRLTLVAANPDREHRLFTCSPCGAFWQGARALHVGTKPYLFRVPSVCPSSWLETRFVDPDEILVFVAGLDRYLERNQFALAQVACAHTPCAALAIRHSVHCLLHHIEALQASHLLPQLPVGRWFGPYVPLGPDAFIRHVTALQSDLARVTQPGLTPGSTGLATLAG